MARTRGEDVLQKVAANLRSLRQRRGLTQAALAEIADMELRQLQRAESGRMDFGLVTLDILARALEVSPGRFFRKAALPEPRRGRPPKKKTRAATATRIKRG
ncbi:MAG: helix-turn-helix transcriptional regulator [Labilithrix sp.]|nr:helix-turn-helix transcriptional regulator [Labilithrix sp.]MCW5817877.1 helix-turn-helix transcriptional regulator [Labilithrix sp.]